MKLHLFDIDGTLISSDGAGRRALGRAIDEVLGLTESLSDIALHGRTDPLILQEVVAQKGLDRSCLVGKQQAIFDRYLELLEFELDRSAGYQVLPGVRTLLTALQRSARSGLALGTGNIEQGARIKLVRGGIEHFFPTGGFGSDAADRPSVLRAGIRKASSVYHTAFDEVWIIGDTPADIQAAKAVGAKVLAVASGGMSVDELRRHSPDCLLESLRDPRALACLLD